MESHPGHGQMLSPKEYAQALRSIAASASEGAAAWSSQGSPRRPAPPVKASRATRNSS